MDLKSRKHRLLIMAGGTSLAATVLTVVYCLVVSDVCSPDLFFFTADQQGRRLYRQARYEEAAQRFADLSWKAAAQFRAGDFKQAAALYSSISSPEGAFNQGNALVMQGKYDEALKSYDRALTLRPDWEDARVNREIAAARAEMLKKEGGDMTGGMMGADDFVFTKSNNQATPPDQDEVVQGPSDAEMRAVWMRQVQTRPADFLRAKFAYQYSLETDE